MSVEPGYDRDRHALNITWQLVRARYSRIYDYSWEELVQIGLVRVYERAPTYDPERGTWGAFVSTHAKYGIQDALRKIHGRKKTSSRKLPTVSLEHQISKAGDGDDGMPLYLAGVLGYEDRALEACPFLMRHLRGAIGRLPRHQRTAAKLMLLGLDRREAAEKMGITVNYSSMLRSNARKGLRRDPALAAYGPAS